MIAWKSAFAFVLLLAASAKVTAFDAEECDVYVFRTQEDALWHCGARLPYEKDLIQKWNHWTSLYCDHTLGDNQKWAWAWASSHPDDWCKFMISTVRNQDHYPLTPNIGINETPGPNIWWLSTLVDWGCYMVDYDTMETTAAYIVDSRAGQHASDVTQQCQRTMNYFDYWNLHESFRDETWYGKVPPRSYMPDRSAWERCHYDHETTASHYNPELGVEYAECKPGFYCELILQDVALCMPDPKTDHECCISWNNKCEKEGDCCLGSECNSNGFCQVGLPETSEDPGFCDHTRDSKEERKVYSRCYDYETGGRGDCALGYICVGNHVYAQCDIDPTVKNDYCKWEWDSSNPRPGDCCEGWMSHCHHHDPNTGKCTMSQCIPGRETGVAENGDSMLDVHDRLRWDPPVESSYNEQLYDCTGAICGVWGDPHIVTCDNLEYDCQALGLFTLMQNHMFNIQGHFIHIDAPWGGASITNDLAIGFVKDDSVPTMQFSFPKFENIDRNNPVYPAESKKIGACPTMFYLGGELVDISGVGPNGYLYGDATSDYSVKLNGYNQIDLKHLAGVDANGDKYYSNSIIWIEGSGPFSDWSCIITFFICLPREDQAAFESHSLGLLGTPNGKFHDDWMAQSGQTLIIPDSNRGQASFDYCVENWCVAEDDSIMEYEDGLTYGDYKCENQEYHEFDVNECGDTDTVNAIIAECAESSEPLTCQMEKCIGNPDVVEEIDVITNITREEGEEDENLVEFPDVDPPDYGDCANLGSGLSGSTGSSAYSLSYPNIGCIFNAGGFSIGYDHSVSVLVGGDFTCKQGAGFEGRAVFLGDMTLEQAGCERLAATAHGSLIHPPEDSVCVEVGGEVSIETAFGNSKFIMYEFGNDSKECHFAYKNGCSLNGETCPHAQEDLENKFVYTNGDFKQVADLDLSRWEDEITLLQQKTAYWKSIEANGVVNNSDGVLSFSASTDNSPVQIFSIPPIDEGVVTVVFDKDLHGKTILIIVDGDGDFHVPTMCFHPSDALPSDAPICGPNSFPTELTASVAWLFPTEGSITMAGDAEFHGSIIFPWGSLTANMIGHSGRMIVGGDLIIDGPYTELHNYEYDPKNHPLPLGEELDEMCEVQEPPCIENYKTMTSDDVCPTAPEGVAKIIRSSADLPEGEPILYGIIIEEPSDAESAHTVKFKVDNPFNDHADIYVKHVKKVGKYALDPVCEGMPFTAGCAVDAPVIEVGCHEYEGVEPFALVNIYFASNTDADIMLAGNTAEVDKCCKPPTEYEAGYGIIEVTYEIKCTCPPTAQS